MSRTLVWATLRSLERHELIWWSGYGFATRDGVEIHLGMVPGGDPGAIRSTAYMWVDDADKLATLGACPEPTHDCPKH